MDTPINGREKGPATILRFPRRRGRPPIERPHRDTGTPELVMKRLVGETTETLDLCLERGIITPEQHWCGIHLRWLFTLRHGIPGVRAIDPTHFGGIEISVDDPEWRAAREKEYHDAIRQLMLKGCATLIVNFCVYNERPFFLRPRNNLGKIKNHQETTKIMEKLQEGLDILVQYWGRSTTEQRR